MLLALEPKTNKAYTKVVELLGLTCADETGRFLVRSRSRNNYLIVICNYDSNAILAEAMPAKMALES